MNAELMHELNENLKKLLGSDKPKKKAKTKEERVQKWEDWLTMKYAKKNLKSK